MSNPTTKPDDIIRKSESRLAAVKALYSNYLNDDKKDPAQLALSIISYYDEGHDELDGAQINPKFFASLLEGVCTHSEELDQIIVPNISSDWSLERMGPVLHAILLSGTYELAYLHDIPHKAIINEYVDIAHGFFDEKEVGFVNSILDTIAPKVRELG